jgi:hypothetical protein
VPRTLPSSPPQELLEDTIDPRTKTGKWHRRGKVRHKWAKGAVHTWRVIVYLLHLERRARWAGGYAFGSSGQQESIATRSNLCAGRRCGRLAPKDCLPGARLFCSDPARFSARIDITALDNKRQTRRYRVSPSRVIFDQCSCDFQTETHH